MNKYTYEMDGKSYECDDDEDSVDMIDSETRKSLPTDEFALPSQRKYPIDTAARVRNAAARLEQQKKTGGVSDSEYSQARAAIARAGKKFGIDSEYATKNSDDGGDDVDMKNAMNRFGDATDDATGGRAMRGDAVEINGILLDAKTEELPIWIQIAKQGQFKGHAAGPFEMNLQTFQEIIRNFQALSNKCVAVDFEHASETPAHQGSIPHSGAPAQGWITDLQIRNDGNLWGLVEWLPLARKYIKAKAYKFLSPAIIFGSKDRVTGEEIGARLSSVALTNNPFLDGMAPLAAKHIEGSTSSFATAWQETRKTLGYPEHLSDRAVVAALMSDTLTNSQLEGLRTVLRLPLTTSYEVITSEVKRICADIQAPTPANPATKPNVPDSAKEQNNMSGNNSEIENKVTALTLKVSEGETLVLALKAENTTLTTKLSHMESENAQLKKDLEAQKDVALGSLVDDAIATYGDASLPKLYRGLKVENRSLLLKLAKGLSREEFAVMYPPVPASQRNLGAVVASGDHTVAETTLGTETNNVVPLKQVPATAARNQHNLRQIAADANVPSMESLAAKAMKDARDIGSPISREDAFITAHSQHIQLVAAAAKKSFAGKGG